MDHAPTGPTAAATTPDHGDAAQAAGAAVTITAVAHGGTCVGRVDGRVVFVRHTAPGEVVALGPIQDGPKGRFGFADAVEVLVAAPGRIEPGCPVSGPGGCGGCAWQHLDGPTGRAMKRQVVDGLLAHRLGLRLDGPITELAGSTARWTAGLGLGPDREVTGARRRMRYQVDGRGWLGLRTAKGHTVVALPAGCPVADARITPPAVPLTGWRGISEVRVAVTSEGQRALTVRAANRPELPALPGSPADVAPDLLVWEPVANRGARRARPQLLTGSGRPSGVAPGGPAGGLLVERVFGLDFDVAPNGFWQAADGAAEFLVAHVLRAVDAVRVDRPQFVVDAYAGVGLFAAHIAHRGRPGDRVVAIEGDAGAVRAGRDNLARHAASRVAVDMRDGDVARLLGAALPGADVVVLDPPRTGLDRSVSELLAERGPQRIVLIACDPAALARDLERLTLAGPYRVTSLVGADLFPQSHHVEVVAVLDRAV